ncbi:MAG: DUF2783 domain-containing protein [Pseudomonadota bacterium]
MEFADLEIFYERLAKAIDRAGEAKAALFLSKLALLLAREAENPQKPLEAIEAALKDLE